jgi:hypothetical protein
MLERVDAIHVKVMLLGNGSRKGGDPQSWPIPPAAPALEDIWQAHFTVAGGVRQLRRIVHGHQQSKSLSQDLTS